MGLPVKLGRMVSSDKLGMTLHDSAKHGNKRAVKKALDKGLCVDYPNDEGQTPLFCACYENEEGVCKILLERGANPNEKSNNGQTPVLMACLRGNISLLQKMMNTGGDLRYHDNDGRGCIDWALMNDDPKKRLKMIDFINRTRVHAMTSAEQEVRLKKANNRSRMVLKVPESLVDMIRKKLGPSPLSSTNSLNRVESRGFGRMYTGDKDGGLVSLTPLVQETCLTYDNFGPSFDNGAFMAMESVYWNKSAVTLKKLNKSNQPGGQIDLLIAEAEKLGKLHHPNILLLMGVTQSNAMDAMMLIFERVNVGSLYFYLHAKLERLPTQNIRDIVIQICEAMIFIHENEIIHCNLSSHAVFLVNPYSAKIGNFEYAMDSEKANLGKPSLASNLKLQNALYNWMAPELMEERKPGFYSDLYSYCCLLWEIFTSEVPWDMCDADVIRHKVLVEGESLLKEHQKIPNLFKTIIQHGLQIDPDYRNIDFELIRSWLSLPPESIPTLPPKHPVVQFPEERCTDDVDAPSVSSKASSPTKDTQHKQKPKPKPKQRPNQSSPTRPTGRKQTGESSKHHQRSSSYNCDENNHHGFRDATVKQTRKYLDDDDDDYEDEVDNGSYFRNTDPFSYNYSQYERHPKSPGKRSLPGHYNRKQDGVQFEVNRTNDEDAPGYHVSIRSPFSRRRHNTRTNGYTKDSTIESSYEEKSPRRTFIPSDNRRVDQTSPSKFSYLTLNQGVGPGIVKPASHNTEGGPIYNNQLSTAGSLYALYNASHDNSRDEESLSPPTFKRTHTDFEALPKRQREENIPHSPEQERENDANDPSWYGGQGSVKNLVSLYQKHTKEHFDQQSVLDGMLAAGNIRKSKKNTLNNSAASLPPQYPKPSPLRSLEDESISNLYEQAAYLLRGKKDKKSQYNFSSNGHQDSASRRIDEPDGQMDNVGQCENEDSETSLTTLSTVDSVNDQQQNPHKNNNPDPPSMSSVDSDLIATWVDDELYKVQQDLQQETTMCSPTRDDLENSDLLEEIMDEVCRPKYDRQYATSNGWKKKKNKSRNEENVDTVDNGSTSNNLRGRYRTDEMYRYHKPKNTHNYSDGEHMAYHDIFSDDSYLDLPAVPIKKKSKPKSKRNTFTNTDKYSYSTKPNTGGYLTTVRVETSLAHPGHHFLTHTAKDIATGRTRTIHSEEIKSNGVQSSIAVESP